jgi:hypothetical protein
MESKYPMNPNENIRSLHHHSVGSFPQGSYYHGASSFYPSSFRGGVVPHHPAPQEQLTARILPVDAKNTSIATGAATGAATSTGARSYVPHHDHPYYYYPYQPSIALSRGAYPTNSGGWPSNYHADGFNSSTPYALSAPCASSQFPNHDTSSTTTNPHGTSSVIPTKGAEPRIVTSKKEEDKVVGTANVNAPPTSDTNDTCHTTTNDNACSRNPKVSNQNHNLSSSSNNGGYYADSANKKKIHDEQQQKSKPFKPIEKDPGSSPNENMTTCNEDQQERAPDKSLIFDPSNSACFLSPCETNKDDDGQYKQDNYMQAAERKRCREKRRRHCIAQSIENLSDVILMVDVSKRLTRSKHNNQLCLSRDSIDTITPVTDDSTRSNKKRPCPSTSSTHNKAQEKNDSNAFCLSTSNASSSHFTFNRADIVNYASFLLKKFSLEIDELKLKLALKESSFSESSSVPTDMTPNNSKQLQQQVLPIAPNLTNNMAPNKSMISQQQPVLTPMSAKATTTNLNTTTINIDSAPTNNMAPNNSMISQQQTHIIALPHVTTHLTITTDNINRVPNNTIQLQQETEKLPQVCNTGALPPSASSLYVNATPRLAPVSQLTTENDSFHQSVDNDHTLQLYSRYEALLKQQQEVRL